MWLDGNGHIKPSPAYGYEINNSFLDLIDDNDLKQNVHEPTRNKNMLDLVLSTYPAFISSVSIIPGTSDHGAVLFNFNLKEIYYTPPIVVFPINGVFRWQ